MIGIYKITNPKGQIYIGQSINIDRRWKEYKRLQNRSAGRKLLNSLKGYGVDEHSWEIIEECEMEQLHERELYWKQFYKSVEYGLNCDYFDNSGGPRSEETKQKMRKPKTTSVKGEKHGLYGKEKSQQHIENIKKSKENISEETKNKISKGKKGKTPNRDYKEWAKTRTQHILQYDLEGNFIKEWGGTKEAALYLGCDPTTITANLRGITKKGYGYIWKRKTI